MIELSFNEAGTLAARVARACGFSWGLAEDIGRAARALAARGEPWSQALIVLAQDAGGFESPSQERLSLWLGMEPDQASIKPICPVRTAAFLADVDGDILDEPLRLVHVGLPIWLSGLLHARSAEASYAVDYGLDSLVKVGDVTIVKAAGPPVSRARDRAEIAPDLLATLALIAKRLYVPESERSRRRGAGGGSVDGA